MNGNTSEYQDLGKISTVELQQNLAGWLAHTCVQQERSVLTDHGQPIAALIPLKDLRWLQQLEDQLDYQDGIKALDEPGENISLAELKREVGWEVNLEFDDH